MIQIGNNLRLRILRSLQTLCKLADLVSDLQNAKVDVEYPDEPELVQGFQKVTITFAGRKYTDVTNFIDAIKKRLSE